MEWKKAAAFSGRRIAPAVALLLAVGVVWSLGVEPARITIVRETVTPRRWERKHGTLRIAFLSDLHAFPLNRARARRMQHLLRLVAEEHPDLILLGGDYFRIGIMGYGHPEAAGELTQFVRQLHAPLGVYAIMGNHELWYGRERAIQALRDGGAQVLLNSAAVLPAGSGKFTLLGLRDDDTDEVDPAAVAGLCAPDLPIIAMGHAPPQYRNLPPGAGLLLAGHTHGGQIKNRFFSEVQRLLRKIDPHPEDLLPQEHFTDGLQTTHSIPLVVSKGIGGHRLPIRWQCPPDFVLVTLAPGADASGSRR